MDTKQKETWAAIFLAFVLIISLLNEFVDRKINRNFEEQITQDLELSKSYGETTARWIELIELLNRNQAAVMNGIWDSSIEKSGRFTRENFESDEEWNYWKNKKVSELWEDDYQKAWNNLRESVDETNDKRQNQMNYISEDDLLNNVGNLLSILQVLIAICALYLYASLVKGYHKE